VAHRRAAAMTERIGRKDLVVVRQQRHYVLPYGAGREDRME
jgi:hypothetical protein